MKFSTSFDNHFSKITSAGKSDLKCTCRNKKKKITENLLIFYFFGGGGGVGRGVVFVKVKSYLSRKIERQFYL